MDENNRRLELMKSVRRCCKIAVVVGLISVLMYARLLCGVLGNMEVNRVAVFSGAGLLIIPVILFLLSPIGVSMAFSSHSEVKALKQVLLPTDRKKLEVWDTTRIIFGMTPLVVIALIIIALVVVS